MTRKRTARLTARWTALVLVVVAGTLLVTAWLATIVPEVAAQVDKPGISGRIWFDIDHDGLQDDAGGAFGEPGVPDVMVEVWLSDPSGNPTAVVAQTFTAPDGSYSFELPDNPYRILAVLPRDFVGWTVMDQGSDDSIDSDLSDGSISPLGLSDVYEVVAGEVDPVVDGGLVARPESAIVGSAFVDADRDGLRGPQDPGLSGIAVELHSPAGVVAFTVTDALGAYEFTGLAPGEYRVHFAGIASLTWIAPGQGVGVDALRDSDVDADTGISDLLDLAAGAQLTVNAGYREPPVNLTVRVATPEPLADPPSALIGWSSQGDFVLAAGEARSADLDTRFDFLRIGAPGDDWSIGLSCDSAPDPISSQQRVGRRLSAALDFNGVAAGTEVTCTAMLTPVGPVTVSFSKIQHDPNLDTVYRVDIDGQIARVRAGDEARTMVPAGTIHIGESSAAGTELLGLTCTDQASTVSWEPDDEVPPETQDGSVVFTDAAPGSHIECTSTSGPAGASTATLTLAHELDDASPAGAPLVFTVTSGNQAGVEIAVSDTEQVGVSTSDQLIVSWQPQLARRVLRVGCEGVGDPVIDPANSMISDLEIDVAAEEPRCWVVTEPGDNRPSQITLNAVFEPGKDNPPDLALYEGPAESPVRRTWTSNGIELGARDRAEFEVDVPAGWEPAELACTPDVASGIGHAGEFDFDHGPLGAYPMFVEVAELAAGTEVECDLRLSQVDTIRLNMQIEVQGEPNATDQVLFRSIGSPGATAATQQQPAEIQLSAWRGQALIVPAAPADLRPKSGSCDAPVARLDELAEWEFEFDLRWDRSMPPAEITCTLVTERVEPVELTVRTAIEGTVGNGLFQIAVEAFDRRIEPITIDREGAVTFAVPVGQVALRQSMSSAWTNLSARCSRDFGVSEIDDGIEVQARVGDAIECTFTNRLVNQEVGGRGDANCDGQIDIADALAIAQLEVGIRTGAAQCPLADFVADIYTQGGDFNRDGRTNIADALFIARCTVGYGDAICTDPG